MNTKKLYFVNLMIRLLPPSRCSSWKCRMLRWAGAKIGNNVEIFSPRIMGNFNLVIGDNVFIGHDTFLFGPQGSTITIENYAKVGSKVTLVTGTHEFTPDGNCIEGKGIHKDVRICRGAVVSTGSIILPGKTVNEMAHVAAGSVVTHDVPTFTRVAGVPARVIKNFK